MFKSATLAAALACCTASSAFAADSGSSQSTAPSASKRLPGGALLTLSSDAEYKLGKPIRLQLAPGSSERTTVQVIKLTAGRVTIDVPKARVPKTAVLVQGPQKVSAIAKGGQSLIIASDDRVTIAAVDGEMLAALGNDWKPLPGGVVRSFAAGAASEHAVPRAPRLSMDHGMLLALGGKVSPSLRVASSAEVERQELRLFRVEAGTRSQLAASDSLAASWQLPELSPGRYEVQGRSVDRFGVESPLSEPLSLRVIGAELPEGAKLTGGAILLGRSGRVKLLGADGLEASYGRADVFIPAPKDVGLARGASTLLRLREQGGREELGIRLEPRWIKSEIQFGPKTARWPGEPLSISVKLFDHRGRPTNEALKHEPHVFVNVEPVAPSWTHTGNVYSARLQPPTGTGPWVVRVEVVDDFGDAVGRDFIELGGKPTEE